MILKTLNSNFLDCEDTFNTPDDFGTVKLSKQNVVIPQGKTMPATCRVRAGQVPEQIPVVFEPTIDTDVPDNLVVSESLTYLQKGSSCILASVSSWALLIIELVARVVPARLIIRYMEWQMRDKWNFLPTLA